MRPLDAVLPGVARHARRAEAVLAQLLVDPAREPGSRGAVLDLDLDAAGGDFHRSGLRVLVLALLLLPPRGLAPAGAAPPGPASLRPCAVSGLSSRSAAKSLAAFAASHFTVEPSPGTGWSASSTGTETNSEDAGVKRRMARPSSSICSLPKPWSARTDSSRVEATFLSFTGFISTPLSVAFSMTDGEEVLLALHPAQVGAVAQVPGPYVLERAAAVELVVPAGRSRPE